MGEMWGSFVRNRTAVFGLIIIGVVIVVALFAPWLSPEDAAQQALEHRREAPSSQNPFGRDGYGRDILSRVISGTRLTVVAAGSAVLMSATIGSLLGLIAGYYGGALGSSIMRVTDLMLAFPYFLLAILIVAAQGPGLRSAVVAVGISSTPLYVRVVRSATLEIRHVEFIDAARAVGGRDVRILLTHVFPNVTAPIIVLTTVGMATAIISISSLSFLGLGAQPPSAEWGAMLAEARSLITSDPHIALFPGLAILWTVLGFNLLGDGLRDVLDPRLVN